MKNLSVLCTVGLLLLVILAPSVALGQTFNTQPTDRAAATRDAAPSTATASFLPATRPAELSPDVTIQKDIEYVPNGGKSRSLDLYLPPFKGHDVPLLIFIHGGGWRGGSKDGAPAKFLANHDYAIASINYRVAKEAVFPAQMEDCRAAIKFLRANAAKYHIQSDHVGVWGGSAGAHLAAMLGVTAHIDFTAGPEKATAEGKIDESVRVQAVIDLYGPADLTSVVGRDSQKNDVWKAAAALIGPCADDKELLAKAKWASPVTYVRRDNPPFLVQHGDADIVVPMEQGRKMTDALKKAGADVTLTVMPGAGHAGAAFFTEENHKTILEFLDKHLKNAAPTATQAAAPDPAAFPGVLFLADLGPAASSQAAAPADPKDAKFVHPGIYHNAADLAFMRKKIEAKAEPWASGFKALQGDARLNQKPHAVAEWDANKNAYMDGDAVIAYACALRWSLTGEQAYADKAIAILNAWSSTLKTIKGTTEQHKVVCGWNGCHLANAAELLVYGTPPGGKPSGWAPADIERFKKMLGIMYDVMKDFQPGFNGNWDAAMMNSMLCIAVFTDDHAMFDRAVNHFHGKDQVDKAGPRGNALKGHLTAYFAPTGQCQESARDQGHTQMGIGNYIAICEVAWKQGVDLYGDTDNRLLLGVEYTAKYLMGNDVPFDPAMPGSKSAISPEGRDKISPIYDAVYQHYVYRKGLEMPFTKQIIFNDHVTTVKRQGSAGSYRPETSTPNAGICWGTLTMFKGAEDPQAKKAEK